MLVCRINLCLYVLHFHIYIEKATVKRKVNTKNVVLALIEYTH